VNRSGAISAHIVLIVLGLLFVIPLVWGISASLHTNATIFLNPFHWLPRPVHWSNFTKAWSSASFGRYMWNSFFIAFAITIFCVIFSQMAGYALSQFKFFGRDAIFGTIVSTLLLPFPAIMVPVFIFTKDMGWINTFAGVIIPGIITAHAVFFMRQYLSGLPSELLWSARIDGASEWTIYWRIVVPLTGPVVAAVGVLTFVASWNNLLWPLIVIQSKSHYTIPLGLSDFNDTYFTNYAEMMAMSMVAVIPVIILFLFVRRWLINSLMVSGGGLKG